jgi:DNA helicase II / ATP-dependent DNA helicase PcrA
MIDNEKYSEEYTHLEQVNSEIDNKIKVLDEEIKETTKKLVDAKKSASDADFIALDKQKEKYGDICDVQGSPYFARMDFKFDGEEDVETIYLGKVGIEFDKSKNNIIDWRAPIGNIYYEGSLGQCNHMFTDAKGMMHTISGTKLLKRSIDIKNKKLVKVHDLETLAETKEKELELADKYLIEVLKESSNTRLKDIIATIQVTQNNIIREELNKIVFIQGCAGSGKSTIALHRIAYLLYYYRESLTDEDILVIAPNKLFIEYISKLLPDLGAVNIRQETFASFTQSVLLRQLDYEKLNIEKKDIENKLFDKGQLKFKEVLDKYSTYLLENAIPKKSLSIFGKVLFTKEQLRKIFFEDFSTYKLNERIDKFKNYLQKIVQDKIKEYISEKEEEYRIIIDEFKNEASNYQNFQKELSELVIEKETMLKRINRQANIIVNEYLNNIKNADAVLKYTELITDKMILSLNSFNIITIEDMNFILEVGKKGLEEDDLAGILYLHTRLNNTNKNYYKHIVIDESQDLSPFEIFTLKSFVYNSSFTIVGDINQRIIPNKLSYDEVAIANIFENTKSFKEFKLNRSYRSSYEIMMFAKEILKFSSVNKEYLPDPIERHGDKPLIVSKNSDNGIVNEIISLVKNRDKRYQNVAIVFRNSENCSKYYNLLKEKMEVNLITEDKSYNGGVCIFPAYLTKGLEFDMVIIGDCNDKSYRNNQLERNLLYVQSTRAMHSLIIMYNGTMSPLLLKIGKEYYNEMETDQEKSIKTKTTKEALVALLNAKFGGISEQIEEIIKEELNYNTIQDLITKAAIENDINKVFEIANTSETNFDNGVSSLIITNNEINEESEPKDDNFFKGLIDELLFSDNSQSEDNEHKYPIRASSWKVESKILAFKRVDRSVYLYNESGIPKDILFFFDIEELQAGNKIEIKLSFNGNLYSGQLEIDLTKRAKIRWDKKLGEVVQNAISENVYKYKFHRLYMKFEKINSITYNIEFL